MKSFLIPAVSILSAGTALAAPLASSTQWIGSDCSVEKGVIKIVDDSTAGGAYIINAKTFPIDPAKKIVFQASVKCENVTSRTQIYMIVLDKNNKQLQLVASNVISGTSDWQKLQIVVEPGTLPAAAAAVKFHLQPAAGPAEGTGTAWFKNLDLSVFDPSTLPPWQKLTWSAMPYELEGDTFTLEDNSAEGGSYLISSPVKVDPASPWQLTSQVKSINNTGRAQIHVFIFDRNGNRLDVKSTPSLSGTSDWQLQAVNIDEFPEGSDTVRIALQPSAGPASGTGKACFRNLEFGTKEIPAVLEGREYVSESVIKYSRVILLDNDLKKTPFAVEQSAPRLEIMIQAPGNAETLQLVTSEKLDHVLIAPWIEGEEKYAPLQSIPLKKVAGGYAIDLKNMPAWRKIALEFPGKFDIKVDTIKLYKHEYPEENWHANWVWFTEDRIENIVVYLRGEFEISEVPSVAMMQGAVDDGGEVYVNGNRVASIFGRATPPNSDIAQYLRPGKNTICAVVRQARYAAGLLLEMDMIFADGSSRKFVTDRNWRASTEKPADNWMTPEFDFSSFMKCVELGVPPNGAWGAVQYRMNEPKAVINVVESNIPEVITAGESYPCTIKFNLDHKRAATPIKFNLVRNGITFETYEVGVTPENGGEFAFTFDLNTSKYLMPGEYELVFSMSGCRPVNGDADLSRQALRVENDRTADTPDARIQRINNVPTLTINGKPYFSIFSARGSKQLNIHASIFHDAGMELYHLYHAPDLKENGDCNFAQLDMLAATLLKNDPDAFFIVKLSMRDGTPQWMRNKHPEEMIVFDDGKRGGHMSIASMIRREYYGYYIQELIKHVASSPYADRIIGYFANEGEEGQWMHYWSGDNPSVPGTLSDYSKPMLEFFRNYLRTAYASEAELQAAWNDPNVTFDNAQIPSREMRAAFGVGAFRDPAAHRPAIDFAYALSDCITDGINFYGKLIKEATGGKALTGALYGHLIDLGACFLGEQTGYIRQRRAIESPYVDYYLGPLQYGSVFRDQGGVGSYDMPSPGSLALHNKIWVNEHDGRTHLNYPAEYAYSIRTTYANNQVMARETGKALCSRAGFYYYALGDSFLNWYDDPETVKCLGELDRITDAAAARDRSSTSDIAVFMSDEAHAMLRQQGGSFGKERLQTYAIFQRENIGRVGSPFDEFLQFDVANSNIKDYKLYIFLNPYLMTAEEAEAIRVLAQDKSNYILFTYAPGVANGQALNMDLANKLTGMELELSTTPRLALFKTTRAFESLSKGYQFGKTSETFSPVPIPHKFDEVLATFTDGTPAVVRKDNIFFAPVALLPTEMLRYMAEKANIDIQSRNNMAVYTCASYTAFHSTKAQGTFDFRAPQGKLMRQLWPVDPNAEWIESVQWQNVAPESRIYELKNK